MYQIIQKKSWRKNWSCRTDIHQADSTVSDPNRIVTIYLEYKFNKNRSETNGLEKPVVARKSSHENHKKFYKFAAKQAALG